MDEKSLEEPEKRPPICQRLHSGVKKDKLHTESTLLESARPVSISYIEDTLGRYVY